LHGAPSAQEHAHADDKAGTKPHLAAQQALSTGARRQALRVELYEICNVKALKRGSLGLAPLKVVRPGPQGDWRR
jgi:hypothetical protein